MNEWLSDPDHLVGALMVLLAVLWLGAGIAAALGVGGAFAAGQEPEDPNLREEVASGE